MAGSGKVKEKRKLKSKSKILKNLNVELKSLYTLVSKIRMKVNGANRKRQKYKGKLSSTKYTCEQEDNLLRCIYK